MLSLSFLAFLMRCFGFIKVIFFNHGHTMHVPETYAPPKVADLLNAHKEHIISVRGNCDSEVDSMVSPFLQCRLWWLPCQLSQGLVRVFLTHGHLHKIESAEEIAKLGLTSHDLVLSGHTHISGIFKHASGIISLNPGSTTLPKGGTEKGMALIDEESVKLFNLETDFYMNLNLQVYLRTNSVLSLSLSARRSCFVSTFI